VNDATYFFFLSLRLSLSRSFFFFFFLFNNLLQRIFRSLKQYVEVEKKSMKWKIPVKWRVSVRLDVSCRNASSFSGLPAHKLVAKYACCPNAEYDHVLFTLHIRRRTIYYLVNLIAPCILLASMTLLEFLLPNECGEKLTLGTVSQKFHFWSRTITYTKNYERNSVNEFFAH